MQAFWAEKPNYKVAYDQLLNGPTNPATSGSVIGNYVGVRDAVREAHRRSLWQVVGIDVRIHE